MSKPIIELTDYPRDVIVKMARDVVRRYDCKVDVHFKFTCPKCGRRCMFEEPNQLFERGICDGCGADEPVHRAGYSLVINPMKPKV